MIGRRSIRGTWCRRSVPPSRSVAAAVLAVALAGAAACNPAVSPGDGTGRSASTDEDSFRRVADGGGAEERSSADTRSSSDTPSTANPSDVPPPENRTSCAEGEMRSCYTGAPETRGIGVCREGTEHCQVDGEFGRFGPCDGEVLPSMPGADGRSDACGDGLDNDCNGMVDENCAHIVNQNVALDADCVTTQCPAEAPYPVGCNITMEGNDGRGCVASSPTSPIVYFQEGDRCGAGRVRGTLSCSSEPGEGLNAGNCTINKPTPIYPSDRSGCPDTGWF